MIITLKIPTTVEMTVETDMSTSEVIEKLNNVLPDNIILDKGIQLVLDVTDILIVNN
jgi:hypothetical protein